MWEAGGAGRRGDAQQGTGAGSQGWRNPTFSESSPVSWSWQRCVKTMVKTACERLLVSFMLVAATVLGGGRKGAVTASGPPPAWPGSLSLRSGPRPHRALFPQSMRSAMSA